MPPHSILVHNLVSENVRHLSVPYTADIFGTKHTYPFDSLITAMQIRGEIPFWNPYTLTGTPLFAEYWWGMLYPPNLIKVLIPEPWWDMYGVLHIFLLSTIVFYLSRVVFTGVRSAIFSGSTVFSIGFLLYYAPTHELIATAPWGALLILAVELMVKKGWSLPSAICVVAGVYGLGNAGHPTTTIFWFFGFTFYLLARLLLDRKTLKIIIPLLVFSSLGLLLSTPNIISFASYVKQSHSPVFLGKILYYNLSDFFLFTFPRVYGPLHNPILPLLKGSAPEFLLMVPFAFYPTFVGGWLAIKHKNVALVAMLISAIAMVMWGFGLPPVSELSLLPLFSRLRFTYLWIVPAVFFSVISGYGFKFICNGGISRLRNVTVSYITLYLSVVLWLFYFIHQKGLLGKFLGSSSQLRQGLLPDIAFATIAPLLLLVISYFRDTKSASPKQTLFASTFMFLGLGFNIAAVYPNANWPANENITLYSLAAFVIVSVLLFLLFKFTKLHIKYTQSMLSVFLILTSFVAFINAMYPGLPERYAVEKPDFVDILERDRLEYRTYAMTGLMIRGELARYEISIVNNFGVIIPEEIDFFFRTYLDKHQQPSKFLAKGAGSLNVFLRNIKYWNYIGVRNLVMSQSTFHWQNTELGKHKGKFISIPQVKSFNFSALNGNQKKNINFPLPTSAALTSQFSCAEGSFTKVSVKLVFPGRGTGKVALIASDADSNQFITITSEPVRLIQSSSIHTFIFNEPLCSDPLQKIDLAIFHVSKTKRFYLTSRKIADKKIEFLRIFDAPIRGTPKFLLKASLEKDHIAIVQNPGAQPRAYFTTRFSVIPGYKQAMAAFAKQENLRDIAFGEDKERPCYSNEKGTFDKKDTSVKVVELSSNSISIEAKVPSAGTLVLVDTFMPGWTAKVNGKSQPVQRVNGLFRGVCLDDAGTYKVILTYRPPNWDLSVLLLSIGLFGSFIIFCAYFYQSCLKPKE
ncbi:MAG: hypothetical protein QNL04_07600 [SAR324 cluster bacterium]|nr:hypothetical protein [SAR324 cluster bacterium]